MRSLPRPMPLFLEADAALTGRNPTGATGVIDSPSGSCTRGLRLLQKMQQLKDAQDKSSIVVVVGNLELHGWHGQHGKESIEDLPNQVWACRVPQVIRFCTQI
ncbi:hypothetical protein VPH35_059679 [Triticum aestivum]